MFVLMEGAKPVEPECAAELKSVRHSLLEDYAITPELVDACDAEIRQQCQNVVHRQTIHCLMDLARPSKSHDTKTRASRQCQAEVYICCTVINLRIYWQRMLYDLKYPRPL